jgi:hypothetical protein
LTLLAPDIQEAILDTDERRSTAGFVSNTASPWHDRQTGWAMSGRRSISRKPSRL